MLTRLFTHAVRRWAYGLGEVLSIVVFAIGAGRLLTDTALYRLGSPLDPGMARITGLCFAALSIVGFISMQALKRIDDRL